MADAVAAKDAEVRAAQDAHGGCSMRRRSAGPMYKKPSRRRR